MPTHTAALASAAVLPGSAGAAVAVVAVMIGSRARGGLQRKRRGFCSLKGGHSYAHPPALRKARGTVTARPRQG